MQILGNFHRGANHLHKWKVAALAIMAASAAVWFAQTASPAQRAGSSPPNSPGEYSPAHKSVFEAIRHFVGYRATPTQPIAFVHRIHVETAELTCIDCHISAERGPQASIPDIRTCWTCHAEIIPDNPEIQKMKAYQESGHDIPWQRVWGWPEEAHVRFNHAPHIRAEVDCATCHGDVATMTVATRPFEQTMGFCLDCHEKQNVSNDCVICHY